MKKPAPILSVVIIDYKAQKYLPQCLESIKSKVAVNYEVVVIDNNKTNRGFAKACNIGAKKAKGRYLLFLNPDTQIIKADFDELISFLDNHLKVGVIGLKILLENGSDQPYSYGQKFGIFSKLGLLPGRRLDWVSGGAMVVRRKLFERLGGFDERFFMYFEDQDLCLRAKDLGFKVELWDGVEVVHFGGRPAQGGLAKDKGKQLALYRKSQAKFVRKYYGGLYYLLFAGMSSLWKILRRNYCWGR